jgi:hypothetical protein
MVACPPGRKLKKASGNRQEIQRKIRNCREYSSDTGEKRQRLNQLSPEKWL